MTTCLPIDWDGQRTRSKVGEISSTRNGLVREPAGVGCRAFGPFSSAQGGRASGGKEFLAVGVKRQPTVITRVPSFTKPDESKSLRNREVVQIMLRLSLACERYDRTEGLRDGRVRLEGIELICHVLPVEEIFSRMLRYREFDVAEMSLSSYILRVGSGKDDLVGIPVFLSRVFRQSSLYVNASAGIERPQALVSRRVGVPHYQMTAAVWLRGILAEDYGVTPEGIEWVQGPLEPEMAVIEPVVPPGIRVVAAPDGTSLAEMLARGDIDALVTARTPSTFRREGRKVQRLFRDPWKVERDYFGRTGVFPIMHTVVLRRELVERFANLGRTLFDAFVRAKELAVERLWDTSELLITLPFLNEHVERTVQLMGKDYWPYGLAPNRETLELFVSYLREQQLLARPVPLEELFPTAHSADASSA